jgi:predicted small integral membrane protein
MTIQNNSRPPGFLPMETNLFDRIFISVVIAVAVHLLWMRFVEFYLPLYIATLICVAIGLVIVRKG